MQHTRVLVLSQYYAPEPVPKPSELAEALAMRGHSVSVITGFPNYPSGWVFPGFRLRLVSKEQRAGLPIVRTLIYPYHGDSASGRCLNYLSFMISSVLGSFFTPPCDVIYVWHPPLTIGVAAWIIGRLKHAPFVYDVTDIWPESLTISGKVTNPLMIWAIHQLERFVYKRAQHLLVVTPHAKENLIAKGIPPEKITVAVPWVDETLFSKGPDANGLDFRAQHGLGGRFVVMYAGNMGLLQGLETVIRCAAMLRAEAGIVFILVGDGVERARLRLLAQELVLPNVVFVDRQPFSAMPALFASADALLVHLKHSTLSNLVIPGKTVAYLAAGCPIVMACNGAAADLVRQAKAGIVIPPEEPEAMAEAVLSLSCLSASERSVLGENGRSYIVTHYSKDRVLDNYERIFARACALGVES